MVDLEMKSRVEMVAMREPGFLPITLWVLLALSWPVPGRANDFDRFGGFRPIRGEATGRWRVEKLGSRWWFVTPEGHAFFLLGVNHFSHRTDEEGAEVATQLRSWGFNSSGNGTSPYLSRTMPHFATVRLHSAIHWLTADEFEFVDVFEESFRRHVDEAVGQRARAVRDNPLVIGYSMTDTPRYDLDLCRTRRGNDWVSALRRLPATAAGKRTYVAFLRERHGNDFERFRRAYRLASVDSFADLPDFDFAHLELAREAVRADDEAFLGRIAGEIARLAHAAVERHDPGALILGEKYKLGDHPDEVLESVAPYVDVISIQPGPTRGPDVGQGPDESVFDEAVWKRLHELTGKPVLICDHAISFPTKEFPRTLWHQAPDAAAAGRLQAEYLEQAARLPFVLGYQRCQYRSRFDPLRNLLKQGLLDLEGRPYPDLVEAFSAGLERTLRAVYRRG